MREESDGGTGEGRDLEWEYDYNFLSLYYTHPTSMYT